MSPKTTLVFPGIAGRGFNSLKQGMDAGWISHGLASLSAAAKAEGFEVDLIDLRALNGWDHFREVLAERLLADEANAAFEAWRDKPDKVTY